MSDSPVLLWLRRAPHSTVHLSEAIRFAAMATALGTPVRLLFLADGVWSVVRGQAPYLYAPPIDRVLTGIVGPDAPALVHAPSLTARGLSESDLETALPLELVDDRGAAEQLRRAGSVMPF